MDFKNHSLIIIFSLLVFISKSVKADTNIPPTINAEGNQVYCPGEIINICSDISIVDPDDTGIEAIYIQIAAGYQKNEDTLSLNGSHPTISTEWNSTAGKLKLSSSTTGDVLYTDFIAAILDIEFSSSNQAGTASREFSITIGDANYLPSTQHFYEYVFDLGVTWSSAKTKAAARTYFGLKGYLITITSFEEKQLSGEQTEGTGWIGGSDSQTEGVWKWMTGPEAGTTFWNGLGTGSSPNYAFWNTEEPNNSRDEDYAHITDPSLGILGSWNDLSNTGASTGVYQPKGYIVEYGGMPGDPVLHISASTRIQIPEIIETISNARCGEGIVQLEAKADFGSIDWYDAAGNFLGTGSTFNTPIISEHTTYFVKPALNNCLTITALPITAYVYSFPVLNSPPYTLEQCDDDFDGFNLFNLTEINNEIISVISSITFTYFKNENDAVNNHHQIDNYLAYKNNTVNTDTIWVKVENEFGCFLVMPVTLIVKPSAIPISFLETYYSCDDGQNINDGIATFNFDDMTSKIEAIFPINIDVFYYKTEEDAISEINKISNPSEYQNSESPEIQKIWVRADSAFENDCLGYGHHITLIVEPVPQFEVNPETIICLNSPLLILSTFNPSATYNYEWTNEQGIIIGNETELQVSSAGTYSVIANYIAASGKNCISNPRYINVQESIIASVSIDDIQITDDSANNTVTINNENNNLGIGDYEFSLDTEFGSYQDNPYFESVLPGIHTIYIRDKNNCGLALIEISVLGFPKFFTPNNDGYNDSWQVLGVNADFYTKSVIYIYDRFGKILAKVNSLEQGWNGVYNGTVLPADDYWFSSMLTDKNGIQKVRKGHFSIIRR
tara:strand:- start:47979 stop:50507 length:2529 start_codon:yes stop_codon:yes gene_type:complete